MRTTLTLDDDVASLLREEAEREGLPFKQVVNRAIRLGFRAGTGYQERRPFRTQSHDFGLKPGIDPGKMGQLVDELEVDVFRQKFLREQAEDRAAARAGHKKHS